MFFTSIFLSKLIVIIVVTICLVFSVTYIGSKRAYEDLDANDFMFITLFGLVAMFLVTIVSLILINVITINIAGIKHPPLNYNVIGLISIFAAIAYYGIFRLIYSGYFVFTKTLSNFSMTMAIVMSLWLVFSVVVIFPWT